MVVLSLYSYEHNYWGTVIVKEEGSEGRDMSSCQQSKGKFKGCWQEEECQTLDNWVHWMNDRSHVPETDGYNNSQNVAKAKLPSSLVSNWQSKLSVPSQTSSKVKAKTPEPKAAALGGLSDNDAFATFSPLKLKRTGCNHKNEVCYYQWLFLI